MTISDIMTITRSADNDEIAEFQRIGDNILHRYVDQCALLTEFLERDDNERICQGISEVDESVIYTYTTIAGSIVELMFILREYVFPDEFKPYFFDLDNTDSVDSLLIVISRCFDIMRKTGIIAPETQLDNTEEEIPDFELESDFE